MLVMSVRLRAARRPRRLGSTTGEWFTELEREDQACEDVYGFLQAENPDGFEGSQNGWLFLDDGGALLRR